MEEMPETSAYPLTAVNTAVLNEKSSLSAEFSQLFTLDKTYLPFRLDWYSTVEWGPNWFWLQYRRKPKLTNRLKYHKCAQKISFI